MVDRLSRAFYRRDARIVARQLLGQRLVRLIEGRRVSGVIVEVEAYLGIPDRAAHTYQGRRTARNASMWKDGGHAYVYFTYGMHHCMNVVAGEENQPVAVLLRALQPVEGLDIMRRNRQSKTTSSRPLRDTDLCSGPAKLCQALRIDRLLDGEDLVLVPALWIERTRRRSHPTALIATGPRIGIANAESWTEKPLRYYLKNNPHVSRPR